MCHRLNLDFLKILLTSLIWSLYSSWLLGYDKINKRASLQSSCVVEQDYLQERVSYLYFTLFPHFQRVCLLFQMLLNLTPSVVQFSFLPITNLRPKDSS